MNQSKLESNTQYMYTAVSYVVTGPGIRKAAACICLNGNANETITERLDEYIDSNNKAELCAIYKAIQCSIYNEHTTFNPVIDVIHIVSKSTYAVNLVNKSWLKYKDSPVWEIFAAFAESNCIIAEILYELKALVGINITVSIYHWSKVTDKSGNKIAHKRARAQIMN